MCSINQFFIARPAIPVRIADRIVRVTTREAAIAPVIQVSEEPSGPHPGGRRIRIEGGNQTPYSPNGYL